MLRLLTKPKPSPTATTALIADQSAAPSAKAPPRHYSAAPTAAPPQRSLAPRAQPAPLPVKRQQRQQRESTPVVSYFSTLALSSQKAASFITSKVDHANHLEITIIYTYFIAQVCTFSFPAVLLANSPEPQSHTICPNKHCSEASKDMWPFTCSLLEPQQLEG